MSTGCPHAIAGDRGVRNSPNVPRQHLLPSTDPTAALICYYGSEFDGSMLVGRQNLDGVQSSGLAKVINRIDLKSSSGVTSCPSDSGLTDIFVFSYRSVGDVDLWMHASGCEGLYNGYVHGGEGGNPSFYDGFMGAMQRLHDSGPKGMGR